MSREACPDPKPYCKYYFDGGCFSDEHHEDWPASDYVTDLEIAYRALHVVQLCRRKHEIEHELPPPMKPSPVEMSRTVAERFSNKEHEIKRIMGKLLDKHYRQAKKQH